MATKHTHKFDSDSSPVVVNLKGELKSELPRFTCTCGYFTTYYGGKVIWHDADGVEITPELV